ANQTIGLNNLSQVIDASPHFGGTSRLTAGNFELGSPVLMNRLNLATVGANQITFTVQGPSAYLNLSGVASINIAGTLDFNSDLAQINSGGRFLRTASTGV